MRLRCTVRDEAVARVGGWDTLNAATSRWDIDVLAIDTAGNLAATSGFRRSMAAAA
jgi:hypothetical protein